MFVLKKKYQKILEKNLFLVSKLAHETDLATQTHTKLMSSKESISLLEIETKKLRQDKDELISRVGLNESVVDILTDRTDNMTATFIIEKLEDIHSKDSILLREYRSFHEFELLSMSNELGRLSKENEKLSDLQRKNITLFEKVDSLKGELSLKSSCESELEDLKIKLFSCCNVNDAYKAEIGAKNGVIKQLEDRVQSLERNESIFTNNFSVMEKRAHSLEKEKAKTLTSLNLKEIEIDNLKACLEKFSSITTEYSLILKSIDELNSVRQKILDGPTIKKARNKIMNSISSGKDAYLEARAREIKQGVLTEHEIDIIFSTRKRFMPDTDARKKQGSTEGVNTQGGHDPYR